MSSDLNIVASAGNDGCVYFHDLSTLKPTKSIEVCDYPAKRRPPDGLKDAHGASISAVSWYNGTRLLSQSTSQLLERRLNLLGFDATCCLWDYRNLNAPLARINVGSGKQSLTRPLIFQNEQLGLVASNARALPASLLDLSAGSMKQKVRTDRMANSFMFLG